MKRFRSDEPVYGARCTSIAFGSDHAGCGLKKQIMAYVKEKYPSVNLKDFGTYSDEVKVDYPDVASSVCGAILDGEFSRGVLLDGAGVASGIAANKFNGIRAGVVHDHFSTSMGRKHNDVNVICLGGKTLGIEAAKEIIDVFVKCEFEGDRHIPRLQKLTRIESSQSGGGGGGVGSSGTFSLGGGSRNGGPRCEVPAASPFKLPK